MADRVISVRLQLEIDQARRNAQAMSAAVRGVAASAEMAGKSTAHLSRMTATLRGVGTAAVTAGAVAAGGMAALTAKTVAGGIAYNKLEQTSRAALTTLTGSAGAANRQMETLREFGKTSPFPRQVWIQAQQQLLAFGMEAEKIIPTFSAIQDAVAAAGGSGETISEITQIIAKIQSTGRVTAEELNELGFRGVDAAGLIADAMGTTAGQVREDITNQAITGVQFIDQLTAAMSQRFGGAAANVKETWAGTTDRIKGAVRDIGSVLATPLVDPEGGGAAVEWGNAIADALRALEARLIPAMDALEGRFEPVVQRVNEKLEALAVWIKTADFSAIGQQIQSMLPAITGITAGITVMGARSLPIIGDMVAGLKPLPVAIAAAAMVSPELRQALLDLLTAAQPLVTAALNLTTTVASALGPAFSVLAGLLQPVIAAVGVLATVFGALPGPMQALILGFVAFKALNLGSMFSGITIGFQNFGQQMQVQSSLAAASGQQVGTMGAAYSAASVKVQSATSGIRAGLSNVVGFLGGPWGAAITAATFAMSLFGQESSSAASDHLGLADALQAGTGAATDATHEWILNKLETEGVAGTYRKFGGDVNDLIDAYMGIPGAAKRVSDTMLENRDDVDLTRDEFEKLADVLKAGPDAYKQAQAAARDKAKIDRDGAGAANASASAQGNLAGAMGATSNAAVTAAQQMQMLNGVMAEIYDRAFAGQEAADGFQSGLHRLSNAFAGNQKAAASSTKAGDKYNDSLKQQQRIARDTARQLEDLAEAQREAEQEAREAAKAARQRQLDELFGRQFDRSSTMDAFRAALAQTSADIGEARKEKTPGAAALSGFSVGAMENRDRLRALTQAAQAAIQAEKDSGASKERIAQITRQLQAQLAAEAQRWGLNAREVQTYTRAIGDFGRLANAKVIPDLASVRTEFAEQRAEIIENSREQMENARQQAVTAAAHGVTAAAVKLHTAALKGNSESAVDNREMMRGLVKQAQEELIQLALNGANKEQLRRRGEELAGQLEDEATQLGFNTTDLGEFTGAIIRSATEISKFPHLVISADVVTASRQVANFVHGVIKDFGKIPKSVSVTMVAKTAAQDIHGIMKRFAGTFATGGYITGPGGPTDDVIPALLSNGEYVINAKQTSKHRPLLEAINSGDETAPGFARGGMVHTLRATPNPRSFRRGANMYENMFEAVVNAVRATAAGLGPLGWAGSQAGKPYIWGGVGPAGFDCCLAPGTLVYGPDGATPIEDVRAGDRVYSYVDGRLESQNVTAQWQSKRQPVFKVRTRNRSVVGSANHPFLRVVQVESSRHVKGGRRGEQIPARFDVQWARLDELKPGDLLVQPREMPAAVKPDPQLADGTAVTEDIAWLIGAAVGDGTVTSKALRLCLYGEKRDRADRIARAGWGCNPTYGDKFGLIISNVELARALDELARALDVLGMRVLGPEKRIPEVVWQWSPELQRAFLNGYCDADGHRPKDARRHGERTYSSCSRLLIDEVRALHIMLGDPVSNVTTNRRNKPIIIKGKTVKKALPLHMFTVWSGGRDGEAVLRRLPGLVSLLDSGDFTFARVLSVTDEGVQDTYDLEVQGAHNFIADGIVVHNSGFMSAITNVIQGRNPHSRRFATGSFPTRDFARGMGRFSIGSFRGNPGHMAGTLMGVNVESRGGEGVVVGPRARGARDGLFGGNIWHLKGFADGGLVERQGDPPFDLISPLGKHFERLLGSYENGTNYVPMDGAYYLHRGESVTPAGQNRPLDVKITVAGDGSRASDYFVDQFNKAQATGRITVTAR